MDGNQARPPYCRSTRWLALLLLVVASSGCHLTIRETPLSREDTSQVHVEETVLVAEEGMIHALTRRSGEITLTTGTTASLEFAEVGALGDDGGVFDPQGPRSFSVYTACWNADPGNWAVAHLIGLAEIVGVLDLTVFTFSAPVQLVRRIFSGSEDEQTVPANDLREPLTGSLTYSSASGFHETTRSEAGRLPPEFEWKLITARSTSFAINAGDLAGTHVVRGMSAALKEWLTGPGHGDLNTIADLAGGHPVPEVASEFSEVLRARRERLQPADAALREARSALAAHEPERAWELSERAMGLGEEVGEPTFTETVSTFREALRMPVAEARMGADRPIDALVVLTERRGGGPHPSEQFFQAAVASIQRRLVDGAVEDATRIAELVESVMPEKREALRPSRAAIGTRAVEVARQLVEQAGRFKVDEYYRVEPLLRRAVALDPANEEYRRLMEACSVLRRRYAPAYVRDVFGQREGDGFMVYYTLANERGELVAAPGKVTLQVFFDTPRGPGPSATLITRADVSAADFDTRQVGLGAFARQKLMHVLPRVTYDRVLRELGILEHVAVSVTFEPVGGEPISGVGQLQLPD
ncbi:MAG: bacterial transcriptional activator domain-containing protein [Planctomycetes bacterium]|nr:bacterial transcriptional activator domain-containing protein [Planctomycetota bacterium]